MTIQASSYRYHLSDSWYPTKSKLLHKALQDLAVQAREKYPCFVRSSSVKALLVPHAAYVYSGLVATSAYQVITQGTFKRVIILAPSHFESFPGVALPGGEYEFYKSRLGYIPLDSAILKELSLDESGLFHQRHRAHELDHSIEMQIPLIQKYCGECKIVPLLMGNITDDQMQTVAQTLKPYLDDTTLLVVSSDMTHYGSTFGYVPFTLDIAQNIIALDDQVVASLQNLDLPGFRAMLKRTQSMVCGAVPISCLLSLLQDRSDITAYVTGYERSSGEEKNPEHSVSYLGMVFSTQSPQSMPLGEQLTGYERNLLWHMAQDELHKLGTVRDCVAPGLVTQALRAKRGAFVTLRTPEHELRGCIGQVVSELPLYQLVCHMAHAAALHDSRFSPVTASEVASLGMSISILTDPVPVKLHDQIRVGIDGVILQNDTNSALFLPSVAFEFGWSVTTMLSQLSLKAGLSVDGWKDKDTKLKVFKAMDITK